MRLKKFNESNTEDFSPLQKWIVENKWDNEDLLYYFSDFTDNSEFNYRVIPIDATNRSSDLEEIIRKGYISYIFEFKKDFNKMNQIDLVIELGDDMKVFKNCLHSFKELSGVDIQSNDITTNNNKTTISLRIDIEIPEKIIKNFNQKPTISPDKIREVIKYLNSYLSDMYSLSEIEFEMDFEMINGERLIKFIPIYNNRSGRIDAVTINPPDVIYYNPVHDEILIN